MPAKKISIDFAKKEKLFYFVATVIVYRENDGRCLILKRSKKEKVHPAKWGVIGGKLEWHDLDILKPSRINGDVLDFENKVEELLKREAKEEANIEIENQLHYIHSVVFIRPDEIPVVMLEFAAKFKGGKIKLEEEAFEDFAWVNDRQVKKYDCIRGIQEEIGYAIKHFKGV